MQQRIAPLILGIALVASACAGSSDPATGDAPEPVTFDALMSEISQSGRPTVVNSWASWCGPCRSEAPLLVTAVRALPGVHFVMLNTKDSPGNAAAFIDDAFTGVRMTHYADPTGAVTSGMGGGRGLPVTFFYDAAGSLVNVHRGILDEPILAFYLDEIQR